jgi:CRISPR-associated protein Csb1
MTIDALDGAARLVVDAQLSPVVGSTFQPTGFANLGAAEFRRADGTPEGNPSLLVESVQSLPTHMEALAFDPAAREPISLLADLPWLDIVAADDARHLTSSREEPHRLAAAYVRDATLDGQSGLELVRERLGLRPRTPLDWRAIYAAIFQLDPLCLVHGVFFSSPGFHGNPKVRRALTAVIEAHGVRPVVSGGLKRDDVQFSPGKEHGAGEGYGFVPFGREEYTADEIVFTASIDLTQLRGYGLDAAATRLLTLLAIWDVVALLDGPLRLRTACDLQVDSVVVRLPAGFELPTREDLEAEIAAVGVTFDEPGRRTGTWAAKGS